MAAIVVIMRVWKPAFLLVKLGPVHTTTEKSEFKLFEFKFKMKESQRSGKAREHTRNAWG